MFKTTGATVKNYFQEESRGAVTVTGTVFNWRTIPDDNAGCDWSGWGQNAQAGLNLSAYTNVVTVWPFATSCGWAGLGYVPGTLTYINGSMSLRVVGHELSHNFGVKHASSLSCTSGGVRVALSSSCTFSEYGDPFSIMGGASTYHSPGQFVGQMGYLLAGEVQTVVPSTTAQTYSLGPLLTSPAGSVKVLRFSRGNGDWFYLDFRATYGVLFDTFAASNPAVNGVTIRLTPDGYTPGGALHNSMLVDTTPATTVFSDAPLGVGKSVTDPVSGITITTLSAGTTATVSIYSGTNPTTAPGAPNLTAATASNGAVALAWSAPASNGGAAITNYRVYRGTTAGGEALLTTLGNVTSYNNTGLTNGTTYYYKISAINSVGEGPQSNELSGTPSSGATIPGAANLTTAAAGDGTVALSWSAPASTGGSPITNYKVYSGTTAGGETLLTTLGTVTSYTNTGLTNGTTWYYKISAVNAIGEGPLSNERSATPTGPPPPGNIQFIKTVGTVSQSKSGNSTMTINVASAGVAAGNWLIVAVTAGTFGGAVGCSDSKGNAYTIDADITSVGRQFVCSGRASNALTSTDTITVTYPGFSGVTTAIASEFAGVTAVDQQSSANGNNTSPNSGPVTTTSATELLFTAISHGNTPTLTLGCGFLASGNATIGSGGGQKTTDAGYQVTSATGTFSACGTLSPSAVQWQAAIVTYR